MWLPMLAFLGVVVNWMHKEEVRIENMRKKVEEKRGKNYVS